MTIAEQIKDYITFEDETSVIYPWAVKADDITDDQINKASSMLQSSEYGYNEYADIDSDDLHEVLDKVIGSNPVL